MNGLLEILRTPAIHTLFWQQRRTLVIQSHVATAEDSMEKRHQFIICHHKNTPPVLSATGSAKVLYTMMMYWYVHLLTIDESLSISYT